VELLNRSLTLDETPANIVGEEYAVIQSYNHTVMPPRPDAPVLPTRPDAPRGAPLNGEHWAQLQDEEGRVREVETVKDVIFRGVSIVLIFYKPSLYTTELTQANSCIKRLNG
jgi:hypothetical protein